MTTIVSLIYESKKREEFNIRYMSSRSISNTKNLPNINEFNNIHKLFDALKIILSIPLTKKTRPNMKPETVNKSALVLLTQMITKDSVENASELMKIIGMIQYQFATELIELGSSKDSFLIDFIAENKNEKGANIFSVSSDTINRALNSVPSIDSNTILSKQLNNITGRLKKEGLNSKKSLLVIDPSDVKYYGKYHNQYTEFGYTGQESTYQRGYREIPILLNPCALVESSTISKVQPKDRKDRELPLWIEAVSNTVNLAYDMGNDVKLIVGDRAFFVALGFGYSYFGLWNPNIDPTKNPRILVPKKIWDNSIEKKWAFLLNPNSQEVQLETISLDYYQQDLLGSNLLKLATNPKKTKFEVPVASIAVFDSYQNKDKAQSLAWARIEAKKIDDHINNYSVLLKSAEKDLIDLIDLRNKTQLVKLRKNGKKGKSKKRNKPLPSYIPKYKGKRRKIFRDPIEKELYFKCCDIYDLLEHWTKHKKKLANRLMFFYISLFEGEDIKKSETELISLVQQYHERWSIENCIKFIKHVFKVKTNSRKVCARHVRWIISSLGYNCWHYWRLTRESRKRKRIDTGWKPYDSINSPPIRKKIERESSSLLTAQGYLLECLWDGIKSSIKENFKGWKQR